MTDPIIEHREQETSRRARGLLNILTHTTTSSSLEEMEKLKCVKCGWSWWPRSEKDPVKCPACQSRHWKNQLGS